MTAPLNQLDWWRRPRIVPDDPPLWRDPGRLLLLGAAICLLLGNLIPWAVGLDPVARPAAYRSTEGTAEGVLLLAFGILLALLVRDRLMWDTTSRSMQLLPLLVALVSVAMWIGADFYSRQAIDEWVRGGGSGSQTNAPAIVAAGIAATALGFVWFELRRLPTVRARTRPLWVEWGLTRWSAASVAAAFLLGAGCAALALAVGLLFLGAESIIVAVILAVFGLFIGIGLGLALVRRLESKARRRAAARLAAAGASPETTGSPPARRQR